MVTGAGGTVGTYIVEYLLKRGDGVVAVDRSEAGIANLLRRRLLLPNPFTLDVHFGDLLNPEVSLKAMGDCDTVIHCAALKHVSVGRVFPEKLAYENVTVFSNIVNAVQRRRSVQRVLLCSSDKAAIPTSVMGASKFLLERITQNISHTDATFFAVRFGNIIGSSGSLSTVVEKCLEDNLPFPLTDASMTRYILHRNDLMRLIETALTHAASGEIWTLNLPSARVVDLVTIFARIVGKEPPDIQITGNIYQENIAEALYSEDELAHVRNDHNCLIFNAQMPGDLTPDLKNHVVTSAANPLNLQTLSDYVQMSTHEN